MKATAELQVIPIGAGVSVREEITRVQALLNEYAFIVEPHASGTNIEGEFGEILHAEEQVHETLHREGSVRLVRSPPPAPRPAPAPPPPGPRPRRPPPPRPPCRAVVLPPVSRPRRTTRFFPRDACGE